MAADFTIGKGDLLPYLVVTPKRADGTIVDISGVGLTAAFYLNGAALAATIFQDTDTVYKLKHIWVSGETDTAGLFNCYFVVTFGGSLTERFPNSDYILIQVFDGGPGQILTSRSDLDGIISTLGVTLNDFSYDDIGSIGFLRSAEDTIITRLMAQPGYGTTVPTIAQIMALPPTAPAVVADRERLQAAVIYLVAVLFGPGETNSVDVAVAIGPLSRDLGGLGETWRFQMDKYEAFSDQKLGLITGFKRWRSL